MKENEPIKASRGEVIGIGKFVVPKTPDFNFTIPQLSFIVLRTANGEYVSTCIHVQMDGYGRTEKAAIRDMVENVSRFLHVNFTDPQCRENGWKRFEELLHESTHDEMELWDAYHAVQVRLAMQGNTVNKVGKLFKQSVNRLA